MGSCLCLYFNENQKYENSLEDGLLTSPSSPAKTECSSEEERSPHAQSFPPWQDYSESCFQCLVPFTIVNRRHHCRRCRNVFCSTCTSRQAKVLLFLIKEDVRVCDRCSGEIPEENYYISVQKPLLLAGDTFKQKTFLGLLGKSVKLRMLADGSALFVDDESREPTFLYLSSIQRVEMLATVGGRSFDIGLKKKTHVFEAENAGRMKNFVEALRVAVKMANEPNLKERVETERLKRIDICRRIESNLVRDNKRQERDSIRKKYNLPNTEERRRKEEE